MASPADVAGASAGVSSKWRYRLKPRLTPWTKFVNKCDLCELRDYTQRFCDFVFPFKFSILDCDSCDTPMAVLGEHRKAATEAEKSLMIDVLSAIARDKWGADGFFIDDVMRQIPDHCHIHARRRWRMP